MNTYIVRIRNNENVHILAEECKRDQDHITFWKFGYMGALIFVAEFKEWDYVINTDPED